jgi:hypothetical protein
MSTGRTEWGRHMGEERGRQVFGGETGRKETILKTLA